MFTKRQDKNSLYSEIFNNGGNCWLHIKRTYQNRPISSFYIDPLLMRGQNREHVLLSEFTQQWLSGKIENFITILGDYGVGKSSLCLHLAQVMVRKHQQDFLAPIPFLIDLGDYRGAESAEHILSHQLSKECRHLNNLDAFQELLNNGRIVLFLDGFDELAPNVHTESTLHLFSQFAAFAKTGGKILLTSRTHYFLDDLNESEIILRRPSSVQPPQNLHTKLHRIIKSLRYGRYYLTEFTNEQIQLYLKEAFPPEEQAKILKLLKSIYNLEDLSHRPILVAVHG